MKRLNPTRMIVVKPGWFTTVQDAGRYGYQQYGVPTCGAMDKRSYILANRLVGNQDKDAVLELTVKGPELLFENDAVIALTGADLAPFMDGREIPLWTSIAVRAGGRLTFGSRRTGARCYLAVAGGIDVPMVLGSRSTHIASKTGGVQGRVLANGDILVGGMPSPHGRATVGRSVPNELRPTYSTVTTLRVLRGPQESMFVDKALEVLRTHSFRLSTHSDRMGYRLEGPKLVHSEDKEWISDGTAMGALQVPPDKQPILLMADCQTTGGYPKIAVVISADLHLAGQLIPGNTVHFVFATLAEAKGALETDAQTLDHALSPSRAD